MSDRNRELVRSWYCRMWNEWDTTVFDEILHPGIVFRGSLGDTYEGYDGVARYMERIRAAFPDFTNHIEEIVSEGDRAFARLTYTGTHQGPSLGFEPTHRKVAYAGAARFRIEDGRIADVWVLGDLHGLISQLEG